MYSDDEEESVINYHNDMIPGMLLGSTLAMHPREKIIATVDSKGKLYLYDFKAEKLKHTVQLGNTTSMPGQGPEQLQFAPNGKYLVAMSRDLGDASLKKQIHIWEVETGKEAKNIFIEIDPLFSGLTFDSNGNYFAVSKFDKTKKPSFGIVIYDANTLLELETIQGRGLPAFFPNTPKRIAFPTGAGGIAVQTLK